jgi:hypothetical protein
LLRKFEQAHQDLNNQGQMVNTIKSENDKLTQVIQDYKGKCAFLQDNEAGLKNHIEKLTKNLNYKSSDHGRMLGEIFLGRLSMMVLDRGQEDLKKDCRDLRGRLLNDNENRDIEKVREDGENARIRKENKLLREEKERLKCLVDEYERSAHVLEGRTKLMVDKCENMRRSCVCNGIGYGYSNGDRDRDRDGGEESGDPRFRSFGADGGHGGGGYTRSDGTTLNKENVKERIREMMPAYGGNVRRVPSGNAGEQFSPGKNTLTYSNDGRPVCELDIQGSPTQDTTIRLRLMMIENEKQEEQMNRVMQENEDLKRRMTKGGRP